MEDENIVDAGALDPEDGVIEEPLVTQREGSGEGEPSQPSGQETGDDIIGDLLRSRGIADPEKIKFEDEEGQLVERSWNTLTKDEKLNILSTIEAPASTGTELNDEEAALINLIRESNQTPEQYIESLKNEAIQALPQTYSVDDYTDDELYILDILDRLGDDVTDEQLQKMLDSAKSDPDLFARTIGSLRTQYKQREDELKLSEQQNADQQNQQDFNNISESILNEIQSLNSVGGKEIALTTEDMNDLANFILTRDEDGNSEFGRAMDNPKTFVQMAFWALKGESIMNEISRQLKMLMIRESSWKEGQFTASI
jgi:hypothetical protein